MPCCWFTITLSKNKHNVVHSVPAQFSPSMRHRHTKASRCNKCIGWRCRYLCISWRRYAGHTHLGINTTLRMRGMHGVREKIHAKHAAPSRNSTCFESICKHIGTRNLPACLSPHKFHKQLTLFFFFYLFSFACCYATTWAHWTSKTNQQTLNIDKIISRH